MKKAVYIVLGILLSACAVTTPTPSATPKPMDTVTPEISNTPKVQPFTQTPQPTKFQRMLPAFYISWHSPFLTFRSIQGKPNSHYLICA